MNKQAAIDIFERCNYSCPYCYLQPNNRNGELGRLATREGIRTIVDFFNPKDTWRIFFTGGEVSIHPHFIELCQAVTERHYLTMATNLSFDVASFIENVQTNRVPFIGATLHPQSELKLDEFIDKVVVLQEHGVVVAVTYVCTPERFARIPGLFSRFRKHGIILRPHALIGNYRGRPYPESYTQRERALIREYSASWQSIVHLDYNSKSYPRGELCSAGHTRVKINGLTGEIRPCMHLPAIGNLFTGELRLFPDKIVCPSLICICEMFDELAEFIIPKAKACREECRPFTDADWREYVRLATRNRDRNQFRAEELGSQVTGRLVFIWGTGQAGQQVYNQLLHAGITVNGFVDNDERKQGTTLAGIRIATPRELTAMDDAARPFVIIASQYAHEIELQLRQTRLIRETDYCYA